MSDKHRAADIAIELDTRLKTITIANGYETDIGLRVYRGKRTVEDENAPCTVLIEGDDTVADRPGKMTSAAIEQEYVLRGYTPCDADNPNDAAHAVIRDLKRAIFKTDMTLNKSVVQVKYRGRAIAPRVDGVAIVSAVILIDVKYVEDLMNP